MDYKIEETKEVFVAEVNTDLTEGRGFNYPKYVCEKESTAIRLGKGQNIQGSDAQIRKDVALKINGKWYVPGKIEYPSKVDDERDKLLKEKQAAIEKAKKAGLTVEDIEAIYRKISFK